ncbi:MAG: single-stranded-DNA-specific exonuclease RecJ [Alphaproteobacteria bacterium]|nr:single-stranded-DNA-specific exonuclease RecJ [Alphaproteobacteria bacterium]
METDHRSLTGARWAETPVSEGRVQRIADRTGLSDPAARVLAQRWDGEELPEADRWITPELGHLHDPFAMLHMDAAVDRLRSALRRREKIRVVTDYDVDGTTSSLILQAALKIVDPLVDVSYHIPSRFDEGYGFSVRAAKQAAEDGIGLVVTADIGVRDHAAVAEARSSGLDVLICDHHLPAGASVPDDATVLCPPQRGDGYPNRSLAACGVSLKLAQALLDRHPKRDAVIQSMLKLAAVGTVADMVSLGTLENRAIVTLGLRELNQGRHHPGLAALLEASRLVPGQIDETSLGYRIGPRINAAGRVAEANLVVELLSCRDPKRAHELAQQLETLNTERRDLQKRLVAHALEALSVGEVPPFVLLSGKEEEGWHRGVVGIVASRVKDEVERPVAIVSIQGELAVGSMRSIPGVHAVAALDSVSDLLVKYGGHPAAAGFTVRTADLGQLQERLVAHVATTLPEADLVPVRRFDVVVPRERLGRELSDELARLGPYGMGNPSPNLLVPGVTAFGVQVRGAEGRLLKFLVPGAQDRAIEAVWWDRAPLAEQLQEGPVDVLAGLGIHTWNGNQRLQLSVVDVRKAA